MPLVQERRRQPRIAMVCPASLKDKSGRTLFRGRSVDVSPCGIKIVGPPPAAVRQGLEVWVELVAPSPRSTGPRTRLVKLRGEVHRVDDLGDWKSVIVIILENNFSPACMLPG